MSCGAVQLTSLLVESAEKLLKSTQYSAKLVAAIARVTRATHTRRWFGGIAQKISDVRRMVLLVSWLGYLKDLKSALKEPDRLIRRLELGVACLNIAAETILNLSTLRKVGFPVGRYLQPRWLVALSFVTELADLLQALGCVLLAAIKRSRLPPLQSQKESSERRDQERAIKRSLVKNSCDVTKAFCVITQLTHPSTEFVAASCGLVSGVAGTHKKLCKLAAVILSRPSWARLWVKMTSQLVPPGVASSPKSTSIARNPKELTLPETIQTGLPHVPCVLN